MTVLVRERRGVRDPGNHDVKLVRYREGNVIQVSFHGFGITFA